MYHIFERTFKRVSIVEQSNYRVNTTNDGGGSGDSGSSYILLPQVAKHIIKRVSTKNIKHC
jgi:tartrate dehydratase alpha subunit/fumarate hydratase class I-like protein